MRTLDVMAAVLLVIGGLNWGLFGLFRVDLVDSIFGAAPFIAGAAYALVGMAAVYQVAGLRWIQKRWNVARSLASVA